MLERLVWEAVSGLADFVRNYEAVFLFMMAERKGTTQKKQVQTAQRRIEQNRNRIAEIDRLVARIYEDNAAGRITDERFARLSATYEAEQAELERANDEMEHLLRDAGKAGVDLRLLLEGLREFSEVRELTPTIVNKLIKRIEVHSNGKKYSRSNVKVDIYFTAADIIALPTEQELKDMMEHYSKEVSRQEQTA